MFDGRTNSPPEKGADKRHFILHYTNITKVYSNACGLITKLDIWYQNLLMALGEKSRGHRCHMDIYNETVSLAGCGSGLLYVLLLD